MVQLQLCSLSTQLITPLMSLTWQMVTLKEVKQSHSSVSNMVLTFWMLIASTIRPSLSLVRLLLISMVIKRSLKKPTKIWMEISMTNWFFLRLLVLPNMRLVSMISVCKISSTLQVPTSLQESQALLLTEILLLTSTWYDLLVVNQVGVPSLRVTRSKDLVELQVVKL